MALGNRGQVYRQKKELDKAIADFTAAIRIAPNQAKLFQARAATHAENKALSEAVADYNEALRLDPELAPSILGERGQLYVDLKEFDLAIADSDELVRRFPQNAGGYVIRAFALYEKRDHVRVIADLTEAMRLGSEKDVELCARSPCGVFLHQGVRQGHRRLRRVPASQLETTLTPTTAGLGATTRRGTTRRRLPTLTWRSSSRRSGPICMRFAVIVRTTWATSMTASITLDKQFAATRLMPTCSSRGPLCTTFGGTTRSRSPTWTWRSSSNPTAPNFSELGAIAGTRLASIERLSPTTPRHSSTIQQDPLIVHNRGWAWSRLGEYQKAIADYDEAIRLGLRSAELYVPPGASLGIRAVNTRRRLLITTKPCASRRTLATSRKTSPRR